MVSSLDVQMWDDSYEPAAGLHLTYETTTFTRKAEEVADEVWREPGFIVHLRDGNTVLAKTELLGSPWDARAAADEISLPTSPDYAWFATLGTLARALRTDRLANLFAGDLKHVLEQTRYHGNLDAPDPYPLNEEEKFLKDSARSAKARLTRHVPGDLQTDMTLEEATRTHIQQLRQRASDLRATAVREMPDPATTPRPNRWIADYTRQEARAVKGLDALDPLRVWTADLPHRLLRCWGDLPEGERKALGTSRRDALILWALEWDLPKTLTSKASGLARTTIDRLLKASA